MESKRYSHEQSMKLPEFYNKHQADNENVGNSTFNEHLNHPFVMGSPMVQKIVPSTTEELIQALNATDANNGIEEVLMYAKFGFTLIWSM